MRRCLGVIALLSAALLGSCAGDGATEGVTVNAMEMHFSPKTITLRAGHNVIAVHDAGKLRHTFSLNALGDEVTVNPGQTKRLNIDVAPGTYRYVCRVLDHEGLGMHGVLRVKE